MRVVFAVLRKEIREVMRDRRTLLLTILIPLVFYPLLLGLSMSMNLKQQSQQERKELAVGVYDQSGGKFGKFDAEGIAAVKVASEEELVTALEGNKFDLAFTVKRGELKDGAVVPRYDVHLMYAGTFAGELDKKRLVTALAAHERKMVDNWLKTRGVETGVPKVLALSSQNMVSERESMGSKFGGAGAYFMVFLAFTGCMSVAVDAGAGEKERGTLEAMMATPASLLSIAIGKLSFVVLMGIVSVISTVLGLLGLVFYMRSTGTVPSEGGAVSLDIGFLFGVAVLLVCIVVMFAAVLYSVSLLAKSSREAHLRASMLLLVTAILLVYATLPLVSVSFGVNFIPVLNVAMTIRALMTGTCTTAAFMTTGAVTLLVAFVSLWWASRVVRKSPEKALML